MSQQQTQEKPQQQNGQQTRQNKLYLDMERTLTGKVQSIETVLPRKMRGDAERLIKRALLYFASSPDLWDCPIPDFVRCVIRAAEWGLAIDGRLCYVVRYKQQYQAQPDYKGLIAVAKRIGVVKDVSADVVCENDTFSHGRRNGASHIEHTYELGEPRGEVIGAYSIFILPDGSFSYCLMDRSELDKVESVAPSKKGPWSAWKDEMRKKTVIRRHFKLYAEDPGFSELSDAIDTEEFPDTEAQPAIGYQPQEKFSPPTGRTNLRQREPSVMTQTEQEQPRHQEAERESQRETPADKQETGEPDAQQDREAIEEDAGLRDLVDWLNQQIDEAKTPDAAIAAGRELEKSRTQLPAADYEKLSAKLKEKAPAATRRRPSASDIR